ncbi:pickpocket protein 11-like isoform X1 [Melanaphis sacchari]|uniref:pickpocket protein 11-like isoform X1 n=1 Tax=Melanaphis sacchari TaxID=742174 RepID=UPI000DC14C55|nr:pickpocket protein 11-like isoform X1 [Melanaphis sacchari]
MRRRIVAVFRSQWFRCAMITLALCYAAECVMRNEPYWETDVAYLHWSTDVPAITVCPVASGPSADHLRPPMLSNSIFNEVDNTLSINIIKRTNEFKKKDSIVLCKNMFKNCSWNGKPFNCCRHFQPHRFIIDNPCFSINSLQTINKKKNLVVSHFSKRGELKMEFNKPVEISLHGLIEVRFGELQKQYVTIKTGEEVELLYMTRQIVEDVSLVALGLTKRGCLLQDEKKLFHHPVYSKSACLLECALRQPEVYAKNYTLCDCPPTCAEMEINNIWNGTQRSVDNATRCILTMSKPATERLVMKAKKDYIDLIVIVACMLQLFTGINLLDIPKSIFKKNYT